MPVRLRDEVSKPPRRKVVSGRLVASVGEILTGISWPAVNG